MRFTQLSELISRAKSAEEIEKYNIKENEIEYLENYLNESNAAQGRI